MLFVTLVIPLSYVIAKQSIIRILLTIRLESEFILQKLNSLDCYIFSMFLHLQYTSISYCGNITYIHQLLYLDIKFI